MPAAEAPAHLTLTGLNKSFGATRAVTDFNLRVARGSFTTLLGPSGCGKTTVLRMLAGFVEPDGGQVLIDGVNQNGRPPNLRGVGMVFQEYALFPHMTVSANVSYGLRMQRTPKAQRQERVAAVLKQLGLTALADRYPHELSGGQQQRVALGRVLALQPEVLLMDEPLSNLDAKLRLRLRADLKELQRQLGITTVYVTHDQEEALSLSDQLVVMDRGRIQQVGQPEDVYLRPTNRFVAEFVGLANLLPGRVTGVGAGAVTMRADGRELTAQLPDVRTPKVGDDGLLMVRPETVTLATVPASTADGWTTEATVLSRGFHGAFERYLLEVPGAPEPWVVDAPLQGEDGWAVGERVAINVAAGVARWLWETVGGGWG